MLRGLVFLQLHNNAFTGTIPPEIGDIPDLGKGIFGIVFDAQVIFPLLVHDFSKQIVGELIITLSLGLCLNQSWQLYSLFM